MRHSLSRDSGARPARGPSVTRLSLLLIAALALTLPACGDDDETSADQIVTTSLAALKPFHPVELDTVAIAAAVRAGQTIRLPFTKEGNQLTAADVHGGAEQPLPFDACWLFGQQCSPNLMGSIAFDLGPVYLYREEDTRFIMGPLLRERLGAP